MAIQIKKPLIGNPRGLDPGRLSELRGGPQAGMNELKVAAFRRGAQTHIVTL